MRRLVLFLGLVFAFESSAFATWSVIAIDRSTGRIVISSSTCTGTSDDFLKDIQAVVVPGKGVAACQAAGDQTHENQSVIFQELERGTDPSRIIEILSQDPNFQSRQFGILDTQGRFAGHTGLNNGFVAQNVGGQVPGTEIFYQIQANTMRANNVVPNAVKAFIAAKGGITDRVMAAMEAADASGGDARCTCTTSQATQGGAPYPVQPSAEIPCSYRTSLVAYILAADRTDPNGPLNLINGHNDGKYAMYITVSQPNHGPTFNIKAGENLNPVKTLRVRYDAWMKAHPEFKR